MKRRRWSAVDDAALRLVYPWWPTWRLARPFGRSVESINGRAASLGLHKSAAYLASPDACRLRRGDDVGAPFRFPPGHVPANKGLRRPGYAPGRMRETQFKPGAPSWRTMAIGSTRLVDGYVYRKIADTPNVPWTRNWKADHIIKWEHVHGPLPAGHCLWFKDGDRRHVDVANLELHTRRELMARNTVHNLPKPLAQAVQLLGALNRKLRRITREEQDRRSA